jgi:phage-related protein
MAFFGRSFIYDSVPSETYGLLISDIDAQAINQSMGSSAMEIYEQKIYRRTVPFFYGSTTANKLSFKFSAFSEDELTAEDFQQVQRWLFSSRTYKRFQIDQLDMQSVYFNCILNTPEIVRVGNLIQGFNCTVECDSPFAYNFPKTVTYTYTDAVIDSTVTFYNSSDDTGAYLYPITVITVNTFGGDVSITNLDDSNRVFSFTGVSPNEVLTVNNSLQTISSSTGLRRLSYFNKHFLRLVPGVNRLRIQGNVGSVAMTTQFVVKKIG